MCYIYFHGQERAPAPDQKTLETFGVRLKEGTDFFIWIRCNPLKRPESAKGIQGNASFFAWIYLVLLALIESKYGLYM
jgi:hypothetical protein